MTCRVAIVGAGVAGLSTAMHLVDLGISEVTVLDSGYPAQGASGLSVGDVSVLYETDRDIAVRVDALRFFEGLSEEIGLKLVGGLRLAYSESEVSRLAAAREKYVTAGIAADLLDPGQVADRVPDLEVGDVAGALYTPAAGHVDPTLLCAAYQARAEAGGAIVKARSSVTGLRSKGDVLELLTEHGGHEVDYVVNAAGPWAAKVGAALGVSCPTRLLRHQVCKARLLRPLGYVMPQFQDSFGYLDTGVGLYLRPESPTDLLVGIHRNSDWSALVTDPDDFSATVDDDYLENLAEVLSHRFPGLADMGLAKGWVGLYPLGDSTPTLGPAAENPRIFQASGLGSAGIQLSNYVGQVTARWICDGEAPPEPRLAAGVESGASAPEGSSE